MTDPGALQEELQAKERELEALRETKAALVARVERSIDEVGSAFHLFETNIQLQKRVEERTAALSRANRELRKEIEERKRVEAQLIRAKDAAEAASRAKSEFVAHMSHELRTPLNAVLGMASMLVAVDLGPDERECAQTIQQSAESLLSSINDILDLAKAEAGKMDLELETFDLYAALQSCMQTMAYPQRTAQVRMALEITPDTPRLTIGDEARLRQVLINLLSNAVKFTERGQIVLRVAREADRRVRFEVEDTGIGIHPDKLERIFEPFTQADASTTRQYGGTGLGLTICQRLTQLMGGVLEVDSEVGRGSTFRLVLPMAEVVAHDARDHTPRVLVVDDDAVNLQVARRMVERAGAEVAIERSPIDGLSRLQRDTFDVVLLDCHMPALDGLEFARRLRAARQGQSIVIIGVSADDSERNEGACRAAGMDALLAKPLRLEALTHTLQKLWPSLGRLPPPRLVAEGAPGVQSQRARR